VTQKSQKTGIKSQDLRFLVDFGYLQLCKRIPKMQDFLNIRKIGVLNLEVFKNRANLNTNNSH
jgi:hypothetical protein